MDGRRARILMRNASEMVTRNDHANAMVRACGVEKTFAAGCSSAPREGLISAYPAVRSW
jgi:hypothetical protein